MKLLDISHSDSCPLIGQIVGGRGHQIEQRLLRPGSRLPSIRQFAEQHRVSRFTVVQAYDRLVATGRVQSRQGSAFYVAPPANIHHTEATHCNLRNKVDVLWMLRKTLQDEQPQIQWLTSYLSCCCFCNVTKS